MKDRKSYFKQYYIDNKEKMIAYSKRYQADNPEYAKQWKIDNPEYHANYYIDNLEEMKKQHDQYKSDNSEKIKKQREQYKADNPEKIKSQLAIQLAVRSGQIPSVNTLKCKRCDSQAVDYHHWSYLPEHCLDVEPLCRRCHGNV